MNEEAFEDGLRMLKYYWVYDDSDVTRWDAWEEFKPFLKKRRPDLFLIIDNYHKAEEAMCAAMENL